jgi:hypothetical protein
MRIIPYLLIILPLIGFFIDPVQLTSDLESSSRVPYLVIFAIMVADLSWWIKLLMIIGGVFWLYAKEESKQEEEESSQINEE